MLGVKTGVGASYQLIPPYLQMLASISTGCLLHVVNLKRVGTDVVECNATCFNNMEGTVQLAQTCPSITVPADPTRARIRAAVEVAAPGGGVKITNSLIQAASSNICDGDVITEFSMNVMMAAAASQVRATLITQPRSIGGRCNAAAPAPLLCYNTRIGAAQGAHIAFGDLDQHVCVTDFVLTAPLPHVSGTATFNSDASINPIAGDIVDTAFSISTRSSGCPSGLNTTACAASSTRLCYRNNVILPREC